ncbi:acetate--CoA ligase family protein [Neobacillus niacini]|uniref:acetate--CoA ligase family protein n=1 Tax=Neobacillus niacini TaxID=86668 RepID=UPI002FFF5D9F
MSSLEAIINPRSIAIVGASSKPGFPSRVPQFLIKYGYEGKIYPINSKYDELFGHKAFPSLSSVPDEIDLALLIIRASSVLTVLKECVQKGVKAALIFSSGFAETGEKGRKAQEEIKALCRESGLRILGPNCLGYIALNNRLVVTASTIAERIHSFESKPIAFISQSGAVGSMVSTEAMRRNKGFRYFVSTGNELDIEVSEMAEYLLEDPEVNVVGIYNESIKDPEKLVKLGKKALQLEKPVAVLKVGNSKVGNRAAASHTGSMAGSHQVYDGFYKKNAILRAHDIQELLDFLMLSSNTAIPKGNRLAIITPSGGAGIMLSDRAEELGIEVPELSSEVQEKLRINIPEFGDTANPIDVTGEIIAHPEMIKNTLKILIEEKPVDAVIIFMSTLDHIAPQLVEDIKELKRQTEMPIIFSWFAAADHVIQMLSDAEIPVFLDPTRAIGALKLMMDYRKILEKKERGQFIWESSMSLEASTNGSEIQDWLKQEIQKGKRSLSEFEARKVLEAYNIPVAAARLVTNLEEACITGEKIGYPVVMKIESPDILHKSDAGCVILNIKSSEEVEHAYRTIMNNARNYKSDCLIKGILIEEMISKGNEIIVGTVHDETFGPTVMFGIGGVFVEILKDVSFRVAPVTTHDAMEMFQETKGYKLLQGARGRKPVNLQKLAELLVQVSHLAFDLKDFIQELDLNPLIISEDGESIIAADALIQLKKK